MTAITRAGRVIAREQGEEGTLWFRLGSDAIDDQGTVICPDGVKEIIGKPWIWHHQSGKDRLGRAPDPSVVIGRIVDFEQDRKRLDVKVQFDMADELAATIFRKAKDGFLPQCSIGIDPERLKKETREINGRKVLHYTESVLIEGSSVICASNPDARVIDRAAALRLVRAMQTRETPMEKSEFLAKLGLAEDATPGREEVEAAAMKYLAETEDGADVRKAVVAAMDELFPESDPEKADKGEEVEALRAAMGELKEELARAQAQAQAKDKGEDPKAVEERAARRERELTAEVDGWIREGRIPFGKRDHYLGLHRAGKAAPIVRELDPGTFTSGQRLRDGGGKETDLPTPRAIERAKKDAAGEDVFAQVEAALKAEQTSAVRR